MSLTLEQPEVSCGGLVSNAFARARRAQQGWGGQPVRFRLKVVRRARELIAQDSRLFAEASALPRSRPVAEVLSAEVMPLVEAFRFLEKHATRILRPVSMRAIGPLRWLGHRRTAIHREPFGVVLIIGPGNYPLFLPGVQAVQALAAGNAVILKPGANGSRVAHLLRDLLIRAGLPEDLLVVLPECIEAAQAAIDEHPDKVSFTGSASVGKEVLARLAPNAIPAIMELSGCDPVIVRADADLDLAAEAVAYGVRLNGGETCMAPRRLFVHRSVAVEFETRLSRELAPTPSIVTVRDDREAIRFSNDCPYALGASIFTRDERAGRQLATQINAGIVSINDLIVPSSDPRIPFGGRNQSGFGVTRGAEGLRELTRPKVITLSRGTKRWAFKTTQPGDQRLLELYISLRHCTDFRSRVTALFSLLRSIVLLPAK